MFLDYYAISHLYFYTNIGISLQSQTFFSNIPIFKQFQQRVFLQLSLND